jgi:uncharacterized LabA/DUF88 family protein
MPLGIEADCCNLDPDFGADGSTTLNSPPVVSAPVHGGVADPGGLFRSPMPTAILVDGDFFIRRFRYLRGKLPPAKVAADLHWMCREHLKQPDGRRELYRIFFYDCPPLSKKEHDPLSGKAIDFSKTRTAEWRRGFHDELRRLRKVALRLGYLNERVGHWTLRSGRLQALLSGKLTIAAIGDSDIKYEAPQKGVDMRIGLDIAALAFKRQVDQIVLVSGDSDFVPAAKLARREGIDFVLDPMWASIRDDLHEHVDGLRSIFSRAPSEATGMSEAGSATDAESSTP